MKNITLSALFALASIGFSAVFAATSPAPANASVATSNNNTATSVTHTPAPISDTAVKTSGASAKVATPSDNKDAAKLQPKSSSTTSSQVPNSASHVKANNLASTKHASINTNKQPRISKIAV